MFTVFYRYLSNVIARNSEWIKNENVTPKISKEVFLAHVIMPFITVHIIPLLFKPIVETKGILVTEIIWLSTCWVFGALWEPFFGWMPHPSSLNIISTEFLPRSLSVYHKNNYVSSISRILTYLPVTCTIYKHCKLWISFSANCQLWKVIAACLQHSIFLNLIPNLI